MLQSILLKDHGAGAREGLQRHLKGVKYQVALPLLDFSLGEVCVNRSGVNKPAWQGL